MHTRWHAHFSFVFCVHPFHTRNPLTLSLTPHPTPPPQHTQGSHGAGKGCHHHHHHHHHHLASFLWGSSFCSSSFSFSFFSLCFCFSFSLFLFPFSFLLSPFSLLPSSFFLLPSSFSSPFSYLFLFLCSLSLIPTQRCSCRGVFVRVSRDSPLFFGTVFYDFLCAESFFFFKKKKQHKQGQITKKLRQDSTLPFCSLLNRTTFDG